MAFFSLSSVSFTADTVLRLRLDCRAAANLLYRPSKPRAAVQPSSLVCGVRVSRVSQLCNPCPLCVACVCHVSLTMGDRALWRGRAEEQGLILD